MAKESLSNQILDIMNSQPKCTVFTNSDFFDIANDAAVRKALSRLCDEGKIYRLLDGYYTVPYYSELVQEYGYPSVDELVQKIADRYKWNISACGETALNYTGISTQVPAVYEYCSDGPYREYIYMNRIIKFKHTANRTISAYSKPITLVIQSIKAIGKDQVTKKDIQILANYSKRFIDEDLTSQTKSVPSWIYTILKEIKEVKTNG